MTQVVIFRVAGVSYALPRSQIEQALPDVRPTRVPLAQSAFDGLVYHQSRLVPVLNLRKRLGLPPAGAGAEAVLLVRVDGELIGLRVDAIEGEADWSGSDDPGVLLELGRLMGHGAPTGTEVVVPRAPTAKDA